MIRRLVYALCGLAALVLAAPAFADDLAAAKAAGQIGERPDGLVAVVSGAPASARAVADRVNAQRLDRYRDIAKANGATVEAVQALAGKELIARTPAGQFVFEGGRWVKK